MLKIIYAIITTSITTHPHKRAIARLRFNEGFPRLFVMNLQILTNTLSLLAVFLHCDKIYSAKRKFDLSEFQEIFVF